MRKTLISVYAADPTGQTIGRQALLVTGPNADEREALALDWAQVRWPAAASWYADPEKTGQRVASAVEIPAPATKE